MSTSLRRAPSSLGGRPLFIYSARSSLAHVSTLGMALTIVGNILGGGGGGGVAWRRNYGRVAHTTHYHHQNVGDTYVADDLGEGKRDTTTTLLARRRRPAVARRRDVDEVVVLHGDAAGRAGERGQVRGPAAADDDLEREHAAGEAQGRRLARAAAVRVAHVAADAVEERAEKRGRLAGAAGGEERARREAHHRARGAAAAWRSGRAGTTRRAAAGAAAPRPRGEGAAAAARGCRRRRRVASAAPRAAGARRGAPWPEGPPALIRLVRRVHRDAVDAESQVLSLMAST